jgi:hypothetical protein
VSPSFTSYIDVTAGCSSNEVSKHIGIAEVHFSRDDSSAAMTNLYPILPCDYGSLVITFFILNSCLVHLPFPHLGHTSLAILSKSYLSVCSFLFAISSIFIYFLKYTPLKNVCFQVPTPTPCCSNPETVFSPNWKQDEPKTKAMYHSGAGYPNSDIHDFFTCNLFRQPTEQPFHFLSCHCSNR